MTHDLTKGRVAPLLIKFTVPLVLGNIFQLTYNAVDSIIVGRFVGKEALAAVGSCNPLMTLMILFLNGLCIGAGILMGTQYGAGETEKLKRQISTTMLAGSVFSAVLSVLCIIFARPLLRLMQVDEGILDGAAEYLRIIFIGLIFTFLYNFLSSTLRALGDSTSPLYFLVGSAVLNIIGDLIFVIAFGLGSAGCAVSTVLSEALCCLGCAVYIHRRIPLLDLGRDWLVFDRTLIGPTVSYGWASAMQQATVQLGKLATQAIVNTMGVTVAAAFTAVNRIDDFTYTPEQNIAHAMSSFMAQNHGAGEEKRMNEGFKKGMLIELIYAAAVCAVCFIFARPLTAMFTKDSQVTEYGVRYLQLIAWMYFLPAVTNGMQGYFRGIGRLKITLAASFLNMAVRVATAAVLIFGFDFGIEALPWSYLVGWVSMLIMELPLLLHTVLSGSAKRA